MSRPIPSVNLGNARRALFDGVLRKPFCGYLRPEATAQWSEQVASIQGSDPNLAAEYAWTLVREYQQKVAPLYLDNARHILATARETLPEEKILIRDLEALADGATLTLEAGKFKSCLRLCDLTEHHYNRTLRKPD